MAMFRRYDEPSWEGEVAGPSARQTSRRPARRRAVQSPRAARLPVVDIEGVELHAITEAHVIEHILAELDDGRGGMVCTVNLDYLYRCRRDLQFDALVSEADLAVPDGMPVLWAGRLQGDRVPERVAGSNLITTLNAAAAARGRSIFLLGGSPGAADGAAAVLRAKFPHLRIAGIHVPPMGFEHSEKLWAELEQAITAAAPDIVWVALGAPKQERTTVRLRSALPRAWWLGVGNSFSFLAGQTPRAPRWMQRTGLEWVHRLVHEPSKLWKRYLVSGVPFALRLLAAAAYRGVPNRLGRPKQSGTDVPETGAAAVAHSPAAAPHASAPEPAAATASLVARDVAVALPVGATLTAGDALASGGDREPAAIAALLATDPVLVSDAVASHVPAPQPQASRAARGTTHSVDDILKRLRALILLGGAVRPSPLSAATGRSVLDMPLDDEHGSLLNFWLAQGGEVARLAGLDKLPVRVLVNRAAREPVSAADKYFGTFRVEKDLSEYRGTAGVLRDVTADYADDDFVLVANACQVLLDPLAAITAALAKQGGDVNLVAHDDGTPSGVQLLACKTVRHINTAGYHDMKEQAMPGIAARFDVRVMRRRRPTGLPIRGLEDYLRALRLHHRRRAGKSMTTDPLAEDWSPAFALVEPGARVSPGARIHDSVVLDGASIEAGAVVVRSLVCGEAAVRADQTTVDRYVTAAPRMMPMPVAAAW
ncbi:MAG: putative glycosyltransferase [Phycisphaerales bacterium]|nr:putative glycosyltransferase [Phycisphaerales bacterium]